MYVPGAAVLGTLNTPVAGSKVEPVVGATVCVRVTFVVVAAVVPLVWSLLKTFRLRCGAKRGRRAVVDGVNQVHGRTGRVVGGHVVVGRAGRAVDADAGRCRVSAAGCAWHGHGQWASQCGTDW